MANKKNEVKQLNECLSRILTEELHNLVVKSLEKELSFWAFESEIEFIREAIRRFLLEIGVEIDCETGEIKEPEGRPPKSYYEDPDLLPDEKQIPIPEELISLGGYAQVIEFEHESPYKDELALQEMERILEPYRKQLLQNLGIRSSIIFVSSSDSSLIDVRFTIYSLAFDGRDNFITLAEKIKEEFGSVPVSIRTVSLCGGTSIMDKITWKSRLYV